jgi:hypothetical protein
MRLAANRDQHAKLTQWERLRVPDLAPDNHDSYLTVGLKMHEADCGVPSLGRKWHSFRPFAYLPLYEVTAPPYSHAPFSSITHWTWEELHFNACLACPSAWPICDTWIYLHEQSDGCS